MKFKIGLILGLLFLLINISAMEESYKDSVMVELRVYSPEDKNAWLFRSVPIILRTSFKSQQSIKTVLTYFLVHTKNSCYSNIADFSISRSNTNLISTDNITTSDENYALSHWVNGPNKTLILEAYGKRDASQAKDSSYCLLY